MTNEQLVLGREDGLIGAIFRKAQNKLSDPAKLTRAGSTSLRLSRKALRHIRSRG